MCRTRVEVLSVIRKRGFLSFLPGSAARDIIRAEGAIIRWSSRPHVPGCLPRGINASMARAGCQAGSVLRLRSCGYSPCRAVFAVRASCDRGQRYCSGNCRQAVRNEQRRAAERRYQQTEGGRQFHRHRQRRYRLRRAHVGEATGREAAEVMRMSRPALPVLEADLPG